MALAFGIKEAPSLVAVKGDKVEKIANPSNIKAYVDSVCVKA